mmetsp:Transcript_8235/g.11961  ORF Transcript_8235/g.11961 Transcript_8235/m.11961 type:complete len:115 (+) Transcript_8235:134-478(+)|eukprot:CAMPEP_0194213926 /NCGR_PEP_ID=MMETSP0156-20130528/14864_1 /TAXON_ID=33649 /ORGANISM="Thalassionema nitzschioides, Strain L26-B" /LENGTH=114 /DNA_ID=CAMNT_0038942071 /DNA_START=67 /DNA_END=411 /DNA_ORIENTATION=-
MAVSTRLPVNNKAASKRVSFQSFVSVRKYTPITDPEIKHQLYYSERDLQNIKTEAKLMIMAYKLHKRKQQLLAFGKKQQLYQTPEEEMKRPLTPDQDFETSNKRMKPSIVVAVQ